MWAGPNRLGIVDYTLPYGKFWSGVDNVKMKMIYFLKGIIFGKTELLRPSSSNETIFVLSLSS